MLVGLISGSSFSLLAAWLILLRNIAAQPMSGAIRTSRTLRFIVFNESGEILHIYAIKGRILRPNVQPWCRWMSTILRWFDLWVYWKFLRNENWDLERAQYSSRVSYRIAEGFHWDWLSEDQWRLLIIWKPVICIFYSLTGGSGEGSRPGAIQIV